MNRVENLAHYESLLNSMRSDRTGFASNCYLLPDEISRLCREGQLYYRTCDSGLLLFHSRSRDTRLMAVVDIKKPLDKWVFADLKGPLSCDFPSRRGLYPQYTEGLMAMLEQVGFVRTATSVRLSFRPSLAQKNEIRAFSPQDGLTVSPAISDRANEIMSLWEETFDCVSHNVPTLSELTPLITEGRVLCALTEDDRIAGSALTEFSASVGWVWHVAAAMREQGVGRALMTCYHQLGLEQGVSAFQLWASSSDPGAEAFHCKLGYTPDNRMSVHFLLS